ncbi:MAG: extracellular solute-binding protein [Chloroflexi bacterium]|nr:extracellular solute-binding protein [Chloroflexota bacterium]
MSPSTPLTRRTFIRLAGLAAAGALLAACAPRPTAAPTLDPNAPTPAPGQFTGEITFYAGTYIPNSARQGGGSGMAPREALAELAQDWMDLHPNINLRYVEAPSMLPVESWINSQILIGEGPDIFNASLSFLNSLAAREDVVPLNDYLAQGNPYNPVSSWSWSYYFCDPFTASAGAKGVYGGVPLDRTATGIYANRSLIEQAGIELSTGAPASWAELSDWCARLKALDIMPFSMAATVQGGWLQSVLADQFMWPLTERFDVLNYHGNLPGQEGVVSQEEILAQTACGWMPFDEPAVRALFELVKDFTQYLPVGYQNQNIMSASWEYFLQGQLALLWDGCWRIREITGDTGKSFEWTSFWLPPVTDETTPFASQPALEPRDVGGFDSALGINGAALKRGNTEECVDLLRFLTTVENDARIVNEVPTLLPAGRGAALQADIAGLFGGRLAEVRDEIHTWPAPVGWYGLSTGKFSDTFQRELMIYLQEEGPLDSFMAKANEAAQLELSDLVAINAVQYNPEGTWDLTRWPCAPAVQGM